MNNVSGRLEKETIFYEKMDKKLQELPSIFREYYTSMRANRKSYTTIEVYINNLLHFVNFVTGDNLTEDFYRRITPSDVESYMISLETRQTKNGVQRMGDDILQNRWSSLNSFFEWAVKRGYLASNPISVVNRPKNNTEHKVTFLTKAEINRLFKVVDRNPNPTMAMRDKAMFSLALATGMRISAILNINKEDIDWENCCIRVIEKRQKVREIPIGQNTVAVLREWIEVRDAAFDEIKTSALFVSQKKGRLSPKAANAALHKYCDEAGIQKNISFHKMRSSAATSLAKSGADVQTIGGILGHKSTATTFRYIAALDENKKNAVVLLDNLLQ